MKLVRRATPRGLTLSLGVNQLLSWATTFYTPAVIAYPAAHDLGVSPAAVLGGFSWSLLAAGACAPRVGNWIELHGGRAPLAFGTIMLAAGLLCLAGSTDLPVWYVGWTVTGAGMALGLYDAAFATAGRLLGTEVGATITGITLFGGFASTLGWPAGTVLLHLFGWRGVLVSFAAIQLALNLPLILVTIPRAAPVRPPPDVAEAAPVVVPWGRIMLVCMGGFFAARWFLSSAIAAHVLFLMNGAGLGPGEAMLAAMLIGPGQVAGRIADWLLAGRLGPLVRAWLGAFLFPAGAALLLSGLPAAVPAFAVLYGMSNGILTVNRGTLPMLVFGPAGYARRLGWLAAPVLVAQAVAPTLATPLVTAIPPSELFELAGAIAGILSFLLLPLRIAPRS